MLSSLGSPINCGHPIAISADQSIFVIQEYFLRGVKGGILLRKMPLEFVLPVYRVSRSPGLSGVAVAV
jgi:hypothetical protein